MEWKSWYSDKSVCWTLRPRLKKDFELKDENDGAFWMSLGDFVTYFDLMHVAHIDPQIVCKRAKAKLTERHAYFYFEVTPKQDGEEEDPIVYVSATQSRKNKDRRQIEKQYCKIDLVCSKIQTTSIYLITQSNF